MPAITSFISPTGGIVVLNIVPSSGVDPKTGVVALLRYANSLLSTPAVLVSGAPGPLVFIDDGEGLPNYLDFNTNYYYTVIDAGGAATTDAIKPASQLQVFTSYLDRLIFRSYSAGMSALAIPQGLNAIRVLEQMPLSMGSTGTYFPFVVMNLDLEQQEAVQIGQDVQFSETNIDIVPMIVFRRYSLSILSHNAQERNFYKDASIAVLRGLMQTLASIGGNITSSFQAAQSQEPTGPMMPGFYEADVMFDMEGQFNVSIYTNYPLIETIAPVISGVYPVSGYITVFSI